MRIHYLQHIPFEDLANIEKWANNKGHSISRTQLFANEGFISTSEFDWLIILGGLMSTYEEDKYPWLKEEKIFIEQAIKSNKKVLGICLGAQLIADVLGARVYKNTDKEIGWHPVVMNQNAKDSPVFKTLPKEFNTFHWHGDTFEIPDGATHLASSEGCRNQAFNYNNKVIGLQFHVEVTEQSVKKLIDNCRDEITEGNYIQSSEEMLAEKELIMMQDDLCTNLLNKIEVL